MKLFSKTVHGVFSALQTFFQAKSAPWKYACEVGPYQLELFSTEHLGQHGRLLAERHRVATEKHPEVLLPRLVCNEKMFLSVHSLLNEDVRCGVQIAPAGECLLDNFYILEEQIRAIRRHLPKGYSRELPHLTTGFSAGLPRVYDIAQEVIWHGDGRVNAEMMTAVLASYQTVSVLTIGELWAVPIMFRFALIENIRYVAALIASYRTDRALAVHWAVKLTRTAAASPKDMIMVIADMARSNPALTGSFVAEFSRQLKGMGPSLALPLTWVEQQLADSGQTIEQLVQAENQMQAASQLSMSNCFNSLRTIESVDWKCFVDSVSVVESSLRNDPADVYAAMDFNSRNYCRQIVEKMAKCSRLTENEVALKAVDLAREGMTTHGKDARAAHVGCYLTAEGKPQLEVAISAHFGPLQTLARAAGFLRVPLYVTTIALLTLFFTACFAVVGMAQGVQDLWASLFLLPIIIVACHLALAVANGIASIAICPKPLLKMDFSTGIPSRLLTLVVVPAMLTSKDSISRLFDDLEVRFLANQDAFLYFGLLTDFSDSATETSPDDKQLIRLARQTVAELNAKYAAEKYSPFFLFHRPRLWNPQEGIWMGHERKRGKIEDLNNFLCGRTPDVFSVVVGDRAVFSRVRYIISLDADTQLPRDTARQLVGAMAHPLNRPRFDMEKQRVISGYGILQPRVEPSLAGANRSRYARLNCKKSGIDPYTCTVSDSYQDIFGQGSYIGKGIYDLDAFDTMLAGRFPDNKVLSHDLLEGCFARSGLLSDVSFYEDYPAAYLTDAARRHRWVRGDWQIINWLLPRVPGQDGQLHKNSLSLLSRWKIFDNLRRSLTPVALIVLLIMGWAILPLSWQWTLLVVGFMCLPAWLESVSAIFHKPKDTSFIRHIALQLSEIPGHFSQTAETLLYLPVEAASNLDAIFRSFWRMLASKKRLLQWNVSICPGSAAPEHLKETVAAMWAGPFTALLGMVACFAFGNDLAANTALAGAVCLMWLVSPVIAWWSSLPLKRYLEKLTPEQTVFLYKIAHKTWKFFATFAGPESNWLPPDNYQEVPSGRIAHRSSPTNMGIALLANLSAYDFGFITTGAFLERTSKSLSVMEKLERYKGHLFNWYDTQSLTPLPPRYISSVDSGNMVGHLVVLRAGLHDFVEKKVSHPLLFNELQKPLAVLFETAPRPSGVAANPSLTALSLELAAAVQLSSPSAFQVKKNLEQLQTAAAAATVQSLGASDEVGKQCDGTLHEAFALKLQDALDELALFMPWTSLQDMASADLQNFQLLDTHLTLFEIAALEETVVPRLVLCAAEEQNPSKQHLLAELEVLVRAGSRQAKARLELITEMIEQCTSLSYLEYDFIYDSTRKLLSIGYNVDDNRRDASYYDLLASEARLAVFVGIAQGHIPQESWFSLGRLLTTTAQKPVLLSWSGSMFEYLMPLLVMPFYENSLLDQSCKAAVAAQIEYGKKCGLPWGISESGYCMTDARADYMYKAFGVPGLGIKRDLTADLVVAPYASALAAIVAPRDACLNLERLSKDGVEGEYGMYEAIDYTESRLPRGETFEIVRSYMAHHQGMSLLALEALLLDCPMQKRFESDPQFQSAILVLQERAPEAIPSYVRTATRSGIPAVHRTVKGATRVIGSPHTARPEVQLLSNGRYHVMVTNAGGGYSRWNNLSVTRWKEDTTCDDWGTFCYIRDLATGEYWSTTFQPTLVKTENFKVIFSEGRAEFHGRNLQYDMHTDIAVSPEHDVELRRTKIMNTSLEQRTIDMTSFAEVVLAPSASDALHPAFSNLFVQTEIVEEQLAILCTRRTRSEEEKSPCMLHMMSVHGVPVDAVSYETNRRQFIGRERSTKNPRAMDRAVVNLSGSAGSVLDPVVAVRVRITLKAGEFAIIDVVSGVGETRAAAMALIEKYRDKGIADRVSRMAWVHGQILLRQIHATEVEAQLYTCLADSILYANAQLRADNSVLVQNSKGQSGLWGYTLSGDLPILLLRIGNVDNIELVRQLLRAHTYWNLKGLLVDLVIWNEDKIGYRQILHDQIMGLIAEGKGSHLGKPGGVFVLSADRIVEEDRILIQAVARVIIADDKASLAQLVKGRITPVNTIPYLALSERPKVARTENTLPAPRNDLVLFNGLGGFTPDGREYVIITAQGQATPAPWANVIANPQFGTVVSETGLAFTWSENAHEHRLTPWSNDPVSDSRGEAFYLRDNDSGYFWSPTPRPCRGKTPYTTRHGFGYSVFEHTERGISSELLVYVDVDAPVKCMRLTVKNESAITRRLSATGYVAWVLGDLPEKTRMHIATEVDPISGTVFACNSYNSEFPGRTAFFGTDDIIKSVSCDRAEFLGRNGSLDNPAAMARSRLSGRNGVGLDPCAVIQVPFTLAAGEERVITFRLGVGNSKDECTELAMRFKGEEATQKSLSRVWRQWDRLLGAAYVETPDTAFNVMANGWLLYQAIACRMWGRGAIYQSGGAFGFRDQLQDSMALVHTAPHLLREQILLCASRQFAEGDVMHWWHPPSGKGVRTHCSDDYLWLPQAVCRYVSSTQDTGILDEPVALITGRPLKEDEDAYYDQPSDSGNTATIYEHCVLAIRYGFTFGAHGLPLMGSGDWNDGMDKIGAGGKGESVWLAFFLYDVLSKFGPLAAARGDLPFYQECASQLTVLKDRVETNGWDGEWYRRAYFDDGTPLGSAENSECRIDSIAQSWSVLSKAGSAEHAQMAMRALDDHLVLREDKLVKLFTPPFDVQVPNPGYIRGYTPGVRENGGQYTHAAVWAAMAFAQLGDSKRAWEIFNIINPVNHSKTSVDVARYEVEPYVAAADVYAAPGLVGRGGWTWYTGSAAWMYRLMLESLLGINIENGALRIAPCLPDSWDCCAVHYRHLGAVYHIKITQECVGGKDIFITLDGVERNDLLVPLLDDQQEHEVTVIVR